MREADVYGRRVRMQGSPWTLVEYRRAFGADLMADLAGAYEGGAPDAVVLLQVVWAMARTWDEGTPGFEAWLRGFDPAEFSADDRTWIGEADSAICAELFRGREAGRAARWRRRAGSALGRLAQRLGGGPDGD